MLKKWGDDDTLLSRTEKLSMRAEAAAEASSFQSCSESVTTQERGYSSQTVTLWCPKDWASYSSRRGSYFLLISFFFFSFFFFVKDREIDTEISEF